MRPRHSGPTGIEIGAPVFLHLHAAHEAFGRVHRDRAHGALAEVLRDLEHEVVRLVADATGWSRVSAVSSVGQLAGRELDVDDGADDLGDLATD